MARLRSSASPCPPIAIGGIGGSGTRLIAQILRQLNYYMGDDLNAASDNLWFTLLFKRAELLAPDVKVDNFDQVVQVFQAAMSQGAPLTAKQANLVRRLAAIDRPQHSAQWLSQRVESLVQAARGGRVKRLWGWKEPNTHVLLDRLEAAFPGMKYIHVMRNGLDMAFSENQNQLRLWGRYFFDTEDFEVSPRWSLKYWCLVHRRIARLGEQIMPGRHMLLNYDAFCAAPQEYLPALLRFLDVTISASTTASLIGLICRPESIGRFKQHGLRRFDPEDIACVKRFGFDATLSH